MPSSKYEKENSLAIASKRLKIQVRKFTYKVTEEPAQDPTPTPKFTNKPVKAVLNLTEEERNNNLIQALKELDDTDLDETDKTEPMQPNPTSPTVSVSQIVQAPRNAAQLGRFMSNYSGQRNLSRYGSAHNVRLESILNEVYKPSDTGKVANSIIQEQEGQEPMLTHMHSIQLHDTIPSKAERIGYLSPQISLMEEVKRKDAQQAFKGDSFNFDNPASELQKNGICPHCRQPLPTDFNQFSALPPDTIFGQRDKQIDSSALQASLKEVQLSNSLKNLISVAKVPPRQPSESVSPSFPSNSSLNEKRKAKLNDKLTAKLAMLTHSIDQPRYISFRPITRNISNRSKESLINVKQVPSNTTQAQIQQIDGSAQKSNNLSAEQQAEEMKARIELERQYFVATQEGKRYRKSKDQLQRLKQLYKEDAVWDYSKKVKIAVELGMTLNQVSKWNWDQRKKKGVSTKRAVKTAKKQNMEENNVQTSES